MQKTLPKGHPSCLSSEFKYTSAAHTDLGKAFARVRRQLKGQLAKVCPLPTPLRIAHGIMAGASLAAEQRWNS